MKIKNLILLSIAIMAMSCSTTLKLTGNYPIHGASATSEKTFEEVWSKVIDYFSQNGVPISTIDKSSGLIVASRMSFVDNYTREEKGGVRNPNAYVVIPTVRGGFGNILEPTAIITGNWDMVGDWNVRIKHIDDKKVIINVNLLNLKCNYSTSGLYGSVTQIPIKSTGVFESNMIEYLSK